MIILLLFSIAAVSGIMVFGKKFSRNVRIALSLIVFLLINLPSIVFFVIGDQPLNGSTVVIQEKSKK